MSWKIVLARSAVRALDRLPSADRKRLASAILGLKDDPRPPGKKVKPLKAVDGDLYRLRVGDRRVIYSVTGRETHVLAVVERADLDRWLRRR